MYKIIALIGKAGSGKDTFLQHLSQIKPELNNIISCTTRLPREGEQEGVNYFYLTPKEFEDKILHNEMLEVSNFNGWLYGTSTDSVQPNMINIGVFNPTGINSLINKSDIDLKVFYIKASDKTRLLRQLNREDKPNINEIIRRFSTDEVDFVNINWPYVEIINETEEDFIIGLNTILSSLEDNPPKGKIY